MDLLNLVYEKILECNENSGVVLEMERVCGVIDNSGTARKANTYLVDNIKYKDKMLLNDNNVYGFEIHHAVSFSKAFLTITGRDLLRILSRLSEDVGVVVGGWFLFDKEESIECRSVRFANGDDVERLAKDSHTTLLSAIECNNLNPINYWTIFEQILGIWKIA